MSKESRKLKNAWLLWHHFLTWTSNIGSTYLLPPGASSLAHIDLVMLLISRHLKKCKCRAHQVANSMHLAPPDTSRCFQTHEVTFDAKVGCFWKMATGSSQVYWPWLQPNCMTWPWLQPKLNAHRASRYIEIMILRTHFNVRCIEFDILNPKDPKSASSLRFTNLNCIKFEIYKPWSASSLGFTNFEVHQVRVSQTIKCIEFDIHNA